MECCACGANPIEKPDTILWRQNRKGIEGVWLCNECAVSKDHDEYIQCALFVACKKAEEGAVQ